MSRPIQVHYFPTPNGRKVSIALEEMGLAYEIVPVNILQGEQQRPEFLEISPNNRIPALVDWSADGERIRIFESGAILQYLGRKSGLLYPAEEAARCWSTTSTSSPATTSGRGTVAWRWGAASPGTRGPSRRSPCASCSTTASNGSSPDTGAACAFPRPACGRPWKSCRRGPSRFPEERRRSAAGREGGRRR